MRYLLDSHIIIWALISDEKLPAEVYSLINNRKNEIYYSVASVWEIEIKHRKQPEQMPISGEQLIQFCAQSSMISLPITNQHVMMLKSLARSENAPSHNDPFDRIIIAQAKTENLLLITHNSKFLHYQESFMLIV